MYDNDSFVLLKYGENKHCGESLTRISFHARQNAYVTYVLEKILVFGFGKAL